MAFNKDVVMQKVQRFGGAMFNVWGFWYYCSIVNFV